MYILYTKYKYKIKPYNYIKNIELHLFIYIL